MAPMAVPSGEIPLGVPMSNHEYDLTDADTFNKKGFFSVGANPPPAWSQRKLIFIYHFISNCYLKEQFSEIFLQATKLRRL